MGISSFMEDFAKTMIVTKMEHKLSHQNTALEIFDYGKTLALLPLAGNSSSIVLTVKNSQVKEIIEMKNSDFNEFITNCFKSKLGKMTQKYERYSYPLISVHAKTFIAERFALIGDAAVGMHPVTAHGFNLGLRGQDILADLIRQAKINNQDIGSKHLLKTFEKKQIYFTKLMFFGTNGIVALFTNDKSFAKPIRKIVLKLAQRLPPIKKLITNQLTQTNKKRFSIF
jgi:ubiquinone biosynthesis UbiH/UbiF/VisC/COQ6 family hydroxylase